MTELSPSLLVNGLNSPFKKEMMCDGTICCLQETYFKSKSETERERMEEDISSNSNQKRAKVAIGILDKIGFIST